MNLRKIYMKYQVNFVVSFIKSDDLSSDIYISNHSSHCLLCGHDLSSTHSSVWGLPSSDHQVNSIRTRLAIVSAIQCSLTSG